MHKRLFLFGCMYMLEHFAPHFPIYKFAPAFYPYYNSEKTVEARRRIERCVSV